MEWTERRRVEAYDVNQAVIFMAEEIAPGEWLATERNMLLIRQTWQGLISWLDRLIVPPSKISNVHITPKYDSVIFDSTGHAWRGAEYMDQTRWLVSLIPEEPLPHG